MTVGLQGLASLLMQGRDPRLGMINNQIFNRRNDQWADRADTGRNDGNMSPAFLALAEAERGARGDRLTNTAFDGPNFDNMAPRAPEIYGSGDKDFQKKSDDRFMSMEESAEIEAKAQRFRNRLMTADMLTNYMTDRSEGKRRDEEIMIQKLMAMIEAQKALQAQLGVGRLNQQQGDGGGFGAGIPGVQQAGNKGGY